MTEPDRPHRDPSWPAWRWRLHEIVFEADTRAGFAFDVGLMLAVLASVAVVMLASVEGVRARYGSALVLAEWGFTILFTIEYALRLVAVRSPGRYARSFFGLVDLVAILPTYASVVFPGAETFLVLRMVRVLRVFRVFKLGAYLSEGNVLLTALERSRRKVLVFLLTVLTIVTVLGALLYAVEGPEHGFTSIPVAMYWAVVTVTTVGYGDISPSTPLGQVIASAAMILGYAILAVPTGIVSVELAEAHRRAPTTQACPGCGHQGHDQDASFCKHCGHGLHPR